MARFDPDIEAHLVARPPKPGLTKLDSPDLPRSLSSARWLTTTVAATGGVAVGLLLGLSIAAFSDLSVAKHPPSSPHVHHQTADWGPLETFPERFGPGSPFHRFADSLEQSGAWDPKMHWEIVNPTNPFCEAHLGLSDLSGDFLTGGGVEIEAVASILSGDYFSVTLLFKRPQTYFNLGAVADCFGRRVMLVGRALDFSPKESARLAKFVGYIGFSDRDTDARVRDLLALVAEMPPRVQNRLVEAMAYSGNEKRAQADGVVLDCDWVALGCELSDRWAVSLVLTAIEPSMYGEVNYYRAGRTRSLVIRPPCDVEFSSPKGPKKVATASGDLIYMPWPRLTLKEIDAL